MNLYFILDVHIKYIVFSILYRHINVPMAFKELRGSTYMYILEWTHDRKLARNHFILIMYLHKISRH